MSLSILSLPSPNYNARPEHTVIDTLVLHYTGMRSASEAIARLLNPLCEVSAHYLIDEDGTCYQLVDDAMRAWHAGVSSWRGREGINQLSIGIELVNPGHEFGYRPFPVPQMNTLIALCTQLLARHPIEPGNIIGHSDVAPSRKEDPGELFDWQLLARQGIGLWHNVIVSKNLPLPIMKEGDSGNEVAAMQMQLADYGYHIPQHGNFDRETALAVRAFQRHFYPQALDSAVVFWDEIASVIIKQLLAQRSI